MFSSKRHALTSAVVLVLLSACSGESPPAPSASAPPAAAEAAAPAAAPITDEAGLRAAAAKALSEQRFYAPAGNSALDHYLALREMRPDDADLATAMLELLPYAVIGIEQAVARQELAEAQRVLGLLERADPQAPSLMRLRDSIAAAGVAAEAAAAEAVAKAERDAAAKLAAEQATQAQDATAATTAAAAARAAPPPAPVASAPVASAPPVAARPTPPPVAAPPAAAAAAPAAATSAAGVPRLLSAPSPRYPLMAQRRKLEGQVVVAFTIQPDGSVAAPRVVSSDPPGIFDEAAVVAASRWRFEAGSRSVPSSRVVQFRLAEGQR
jgi:protein TonB